MYQAVGLIRMPKLPRKFSATGSTTMQPSATTTKTSAPKVKVSERRLSWMKLRFSSCSS